jgi:hypothetical protein
VHNPVPVEMAHFHRHLAKDAPGVHGGAVGALGRPARREASVEAPVPVAECAVPVIIPRSHVCSECSQALRSPARFDYICTAFILVHVNGDR